MATSITKQKGISIVETVLATAIFAIFSIGIFYLSIDTIQRDSKIELSNNALFYAQEGLEAVRNIRDRDYLSVTNGDHGLDFQSEAWSFVQAPENIDGYYSRTISIEDVYRDENGNIAETGTPDQDTKKIVSEVYWSLRGVIPKTASLTGYISNWRGDEWIQTTCAEFDEGNFDDTETSGTAAPPADNCSVQLMTSEIPSGFFVSSNIGDHGNDVVVDGNYAYVANGKTQNGLSIIDISDVNNPIVASEIDVKEKGRRLTKDGNYVYVGVEKESGGLAIVNVSNPNSPSLVSTLNVGSKGNNLRVSNNYLLMGIEEDDDSFKVIDITNKANPSVVGDLDFDDETRAVYISGNYAYLGTDDEDKAFRIVDITNPLLPSAMGFLEFDHSVEAIITSGIFAFVGTRDSNNSFGVVNISDPSNPTKITSIDAGGKITDIAISGNYAYVSLDEENPGLAVINIANPLSPYLVYNQDITGKGTGAYADEEYVYITTKTNNNGLVILRTISTQVLLNGTYKSVSYDTGSDDTRYNFIEWEQVTPPESSIKLQIKTADTLQGLSTAKWVGPDGTSGSFYDTPRTSIVLDPARSGERFYQYRAYFTSDEVNTPTLDSVGINYTP